MSKEEIQECMCCGILLDTDKTPAYLYADNGGSYVSSSGVCSTCFRKLIILYRRSGKKFRKSKGYAK